MLTGGKEDELIISSGRQGPFTNGPLPERCLCEKDGRFTNRPYGSLSIGVLQTSAAVMAASSSSYSVKAGSWG